MFLLKTIGIALATPTILSIFFLSKEKLIQKKELIFNLIQKKESKSFSLVNLL